jgi:hypothetical protein
MYESKLEKAKGLIEKHNAGLDEKDRLNADAFVADLKKAGGTTDEGLRQCSWEDLQDCGLPKLLAKQVATVFREGGTEEKKDVVTEKKAGGMTVQQLLEHYDPRDADNHVGKRLTTLAKSQRCVIFNSDSSVNVGASEKLIAEIRDGYPERETFPVDGRPMKIYRVGERPQELADENPLYPGRLLRPNGDCDQTNRSWEGVSYEVRVLLYLAVTKTNELRIDSVGKAQDEMDRAIATNVMQFLPSRYPKASLLFDELKSRSELPSLKLPKGNQDGRPQDPFHRSTHVRH